MSLADEVAGREWYHTIELSPGVVTPGWFDTRTVEGRLPWPDLTGLRCLDVGTFDGYWAFAMERRGAAEVVAVDVLDPAQWDWPPGSVDAVRDAIGARKGRGDGFVVAAEALGSTVERRELNVYDLDPTVVGTFDVVYLGSILLHLRDPLRALAAVRSVVRDGGTLLAVDAVDWALTLSHPRTPVATLDGVGRPWWWKVNLAGLARLVAVSGFDVEGTPQRLSMPPGAGQATARPRPRLLASRPGREALVTAWRGDPHGAVRARAV